jgi:hypothetical protein
VLQLPTAYREALWAATYLAITPILQEKLRGVEALEPYPSATWALGAVSAGLLGAVATHPFDTVKTRMQVRIKVLWSCCPYTVHTVDSVSF